MPSNNNLKINPKIVFREEGEEALLFNPDNGTVKVLNETGKFIWSNLDGKNTEDELIVKMKEAFNITDENKTKDDLNTFLAELKKLKFLEDSLEKSP